ncbi:CotY/CotZ family spore coat protein [Tenuibacillus multivorans]|uniref:Spore coat protein Z n=1 Tax=Tenuibacillus multivorans TaxID=237069 RepID=A0A1H0EJ21_9BACI|nr:CotY/CotZ family spore coat protein [Tenuibacillus multivorans]GEL77138.1 spore coat protein Y [Tenuibacillus multivorans]SDN82331.1 spore coat protein Z [Tenuibacillus multivorans]
MSCRGKDNTENCVCDILRQIVEAQNDIVDDDCCDISCEQSIQDLMGDTTSPTNLDTVPVLLYCDCKPFKGFGVRNDQNRTVLGSFYFRVKSVDDDCCAVLELLRDPACTRQNPSDPTEQKTANLRTTGICINVDLKCFCHVTCLPATDAL